MSELLSGSSRTPDVGSVPPTVDTPQPTPTPGCTTGGPRRPPSPWRYWNDEGVSIALSDPSALGMATRSGRPPPLGGPARRGIGGGRPRLALPGNPEWIGGGDVERLNRPGRRRGGVSGAQSDASGPPCVPDWPRPLRPPPLTYSKNKPGCRPPPTSATASPRPPSAAYPCSPAAKTMPPQSSGTQPRKQERGTAAKRKMIEAAAALIAEGGLSHATMARIGERAGYSRGLADYHFTSKLRCSRLWPNP
jgi:hypothetical protein